MTLSPVLHVASGQLMLGQVLDHNARPLTKEEIEAHIKEFEQLTRLKEHHARFPVLDAKWLDPECHNGCKSLVFKSCSDLSRELADRLRVFANSHRQIHTAQDVAAAKESVARYDAFTSPAPSA